MFTVTEKANEMIKDFMKNRTEGLPIRVMVFEGGCSGTSLGMALDEQKQDDHVFEDNGLKFVINQDLLSEIQPVTVDFIETPHGSGFKLSSNFVSAGGGCDSCSSCG
jgi:iron-sulfur cluster assembly accessory protein